MGRQRDVLKEIDCLRSKPVAYTLGFILTPYFNMFYFFSWVSFLWSRKCLYLLNLYEMILHVAIIFVFIFFLNFVFLLTYLFCDYYFKVMHFSISSCPVSRFSNSTGDAWYLLLYKGSYGEYLSIENWQFCRVTYF